MPTHTPFEPKTPVSIDAGLTIRDADGQPLAIGYQSELETGAGFLGIERPAPNRQPLLVKVVVTGIASDQHDEALPGVYGHEVHLSRAVAREAMTAAEAGAIAEAVLDSFHDEQGIEELDDFVIEVQLADGTVIHEMTDSSAHASDVVDRVEHLNKIEDLPLGDAPARPRG